MKRVAGGMDANERVAGLDPIQKTLRVGKGRSPVVLAKRTPS